MAQVILSWTCDEGAYISIKRVYNNTEEILAVFLPAMPNYYSDTVTEPGKYLYYIQARNERGETTEIIEVDIVLSKPKLQNIQASVIY